MILILASTSAARRAMLRAAGVPHEAHAPGIDEEELKALLRAEGVGAARMADALAEHKAAQVSRRFPDALVLGADQVLQLDGGEMMDKPACLEAAAAQLRRLRGGTHELISAAAVAQGGVVHWRTTDRAELTMRDFSDAFLERYLALAGETLLGTVGGYHLEGLGAQLFARVRGEYFTILGLPLVPVLGYLRERGVVAR